MATVSSVNQLKIAIAFAERQVARDQSQVQSDVARLQQSRVQLQTDSRALNNVQQQGLAAQAAQAKNAIAAAPARTKEAGAEKPAPAPEAAPAAAPVRAQLNTQGETIGKLINTVA